MTMAAAPNGEARHILVVDDDARLRRLLQRYLTEHRYHVTTAADAAEARASLRNFAFDLMVLDVMMPGQDGVSLTAELRDRDRPADPAADRARRDRGPGQGAVGRRRRLSGQAVRPARAAAQDRDHPAARRPGRAGRPAAALRPVRLRRRLAGAAARRGAHPSDRRRAVAAADPGRAARARDHAPGARPAQPHQRLGSRDRHPDRPAPAQAGARSAPSPLSFDQAWRRLCTQAWQLAIKPNWRRRSRACRGSSRAACSAARC